MEKKFRELLDGECRLRAEADTMLAETGLGTMIHEAGYQSVGSYVMHTMMWRDLDFERTEDKPDWQRHWEFGMKLAQTGLIWKFSCVNEYHHHRNTVPDAGLYWGLQFDYPKGGPIWKIDLWTAKPEEFQSGSPRRVEWMSQLTDEMRFHILEIKNAVWSSTEYGKSLLSVHIYEAVLDWNIYGIEEFQDWWKTCYGKGKWIF
jgi:hypothetical protein